jgi:hypothetical protein
MATVEFRYDPKNTAWFTANAAMVLKAGEPAYHDTTGLFKLGDGVTALSALSFLPIVSSSTPTIQQVLTTGNVATTTIETTGFIKTGGLSTQFLKADGSVDSNVYGVGNALTTNPLSQFAATTSSQLAGVISDETGTGSLVFGTSPTFTTQITTPLINPSTFLNIGNAAVAGGALSKMRVGVGTSFIDLGQSQSGNAAIWMGIATPGQFNYSIRQSGTSLVLNAQAGGTLALTVAATSILSLGINNISFIAQSSAFAAIGTPYTFTVPANTNQTLGTNIPNFRVTGNNKQWATGALATQYFNYFTANTVSFVGASTATDVYNLFVESPIAGVNATITNRYALGLAGSLKINDTFNIVFDTTTGTKIATATTQKISFWNATPIVQPTTAVASATVVSGTGGNVKHDDTFDGYTVEQVVRALRTIGLLA